MATKRWTGQAAKVTQVTKVTYSTISSGVTYRLIINGKQVTFTSTTAALADIVDGLVAAWNASAEPEHGEMIAARREDPTLSGVQLTGRVSGEFYTVTASASSGTATVTEPVSASGPEFWNAAGNWSGGTLPVAADDLILENYSGRIRSGLVDTNNYASVTIAASFTGEIGRPVTNTEIGSAGYPEYRPTRLKLGTGSAITYKIGEGSGNGSSLVRLDANASNATFTCYRTGSATGNNEYPLDAIGLGSGSAVKIYGGSVSIVGTSLASVNVFSPSQQGGLLSGLTVDLGTSTGTTLNIYGGTVYYAGTFTTVIARTGAQVTPRYSAASGTVKVGEQARVNWNSSGGITTLLEVEPGGAADFSGEASAKTVADCKIHSGGRIADPAGVVTWTAGVKLQGCRIGDVDVDLGVGYVI